MSPWPRAPPGLRKAIQPSRGTKEEWLLCCALQAQLSPRERAELAVAVTLLQRLADV